MTHLYCPVIVHWYEPGRWSLVLWLYLMTLALCAVDDGCLLMLCVLLLLKWYNIIIIIIDDIIGIWYIWK